MTGPDGNFYAVSSGSTDDGFSSTVIARLTPAGVVTSIVSEPRSEEGSVGTLIAGPDGALWFTRAATGAQGGRIVRMTTDGIVTARYQLPDDPHELVFGADGNLWFTQTVGREPGVRISRVQLSLAVPLPGATATGAAPTAASGASPPVAPAGQPQPASDR